MRSGLAGLAYVLGNLAPLFLMCDPSDLGTHIEPVENKTFIQPTIVLYDAVPAGIGFSQKLFEMHNEMMARALELVSDCPCVDAADRPVSCSAARLNITTCPLALTAMTPLSIVATIFSMYSLARTT